MISNNIKLNILAEERNVDLRLLQKGPYPVSMETLLSFLEGTPGAFSSTTKRLRMPQFCPRVGCIREYQWKLADQMFRRSGFVVAPCGSGKTLIGCLIAVLNGGRFLILTTRYAQQWKHALDTFFTPNDPDVRIVIADGQSSYFPSGSTFPTVVITTYSAFGTSNERHRLLKQIVYDTIILDEVHTAAAKTHLSLIRGLHSVYSCGLTATKVREDDELAKLESEFGKGSVNAEIDRRTLVKAGFVANVRVIHVVVPYSISQKQLQPEMGKSRMLGLHAHKIQVLYSSLKRLCVEKHKIIVFCDDLFGLEWVSRIAVANAIPSVGQISMRTPVEIRCKILTKFSEESAPKVIFMSRTGDEALDIPCASASVVFWNNWGSRRQIVQRIGRLARPCVGVDPIFLVILLNHHTEIKISKRREDYLVEHGFEIATCQHDKSPYGVKLLKQENEYTKQLLHAWHAWKQQQN